MGEKHRNNHRKFLILYLLIIIVFAFIYWVLPRDMFTRKLTGLIDSFYFSTVTATTLGYGDISPTNPFSKLLVGVESISGLIILGFFLEAISKKRDIDIKKEIAKEKILSRLAIYTEIYHFMIRKIIFYKSIQLDLIEIGKIEGKDEEKEFLNFFRDEHINKKIISNINLNGPSRTSSKESWIRHIDKTFSDLYIRSEKIINRYYHNLPPKVFFAFNTLESASSLTSMKYYGFFHTISIEEIESLRAIYKYCLEERKKLLVDLSEKEYNILSTSLDIYFKELLKRVN